jgi:hypothetical protein
MTDAEKALREAEAAIATLWRRPDYENKKAAIAQLRAAVAAGREACAQFFSDRAAQFWKASQRSEAQGYLETAKEWAEKAKDEEDRASAIRALGGRREE